MENEESGFIGVMPNVVLIGGHARAGKGTIASQFYWNSRHLEEAFARPIYNMIAEMIRGTEPHLVGTRQDIVRWIQENKDNPAVVIPGTSCTLRSAMQTLGTEWGQGYVAQPVWANLLTARVDEAVRQRGGHPPYITISDYRFPHEWEVLMEWCHKRGYTMHTIVVMRPDAAGITMSHESEQRIASLPRDYTIQNDGTLDDLRRRVLDSIDAWRRATGKYF